MSCGGTDMPSEFFLDQLGSRRGSVGFPPLVNQKPRERLWDRVTGRAPSPLPKGIKMKPGAEWLKPGLVGRVKHLRGDEELRHATLEAIVNERR